MKKFLLKFVAFTTLLTGVVSCGQNNSSSFVDTSKPQFDVEPTTFDHYFSDRVSFADMGIDINGKTFLRDKVERVKLAKGGTEYCGIKSVTDGDTAVFYTNGWPDSYTNPLKKEYNYFTVRFLGIDTPESTSNVAPWGKKASAYAKDILGNAAGIIVDATSINTDNTALYPDIQSTFKAGCRLDSNGSRWLALVWYCPAGKDPENYKNYRSFQLDMIEECYSYYTGNLGDTNYCLNIDPSLEPLLYKYVEDTYGSMKLADVLLYADIRMQLLKKRYTGSEIDPDYDYSTTPTEITITEALENMETYEANATFVQLKGVITRFVAKNFFFQDENGNGLYVYLGVNAKGILKQYRVGDTIQIRGRLVTYGGQPQLTDIIFNEDTFKKITGEGAIPLPEPKDITSTNYTTTTLKEDLCQYVTCTLNVRSNNNFNQSKDGSFTVYCTDVVTDLTGLTTYDKLSIRINGTLAPGYTLDEAKEWKGKQVQVTGILSVYTEIDLVDVKAGEDNYPSYQIVVGNRTAIDDETLASDIQILSAE